MKGRIGKANILFFVLGAGLFVFLVNKFGFDRIVQNMERAGWSLVQVIGVWFFIYLLNTFAWKLVLGEKANGLAFPRLFMVTVSGFVINYMTPVIALGGEPYRVRALSTTLGMQQSVSTVVLYRMVHLLGHMLLLLAGIQAALIALGFPAPVNLLLGATALVLVGIIVVTLAGQKRGVFEFLHRLIRKIPVLSRLAAPLSRYESNLQDMDRHITSLYHHSRGKLYLAVALEFLSRALMGVEVYLILSGIGMTMSFVSALFVYISYSVIINLLFFVPFNIGAREGGIALGLGSLALPPLLGIYLGVVMRIREFVWICLGLLFILLTTDKRAEPPELTHSRPSAATRS
jgi:uncharacterized protein (TIRG00374 family)